MKKQIFKLGLLLFLTSCFSTAKTIELKNRNFDEAPLNVILNREIGDKLLMAGEEEYQEGIKLVECPSFKLNSTTFLYRKGDIIPLSGSKNNWNLYYNTKYALTGDYQGIAIDKKNKNIIMPFFYSFARGGMVTKKVEELKIEPATYVADCKSCFRQEFIFNGKSGSNLKFIYREYINDMARPAFNQELQYDLNESKIVGFKGVRIEIINVTNTNIEYKILSSFTKR